MLNPFGRETCGKNKRYQNKPGDRDKAEMRLIVIEKFDGKPLQLFTEPSIQRATASKMWFSGCLEKM